MEPDMKDHAQQTLKDAFIITFTMIAALLAAEGRMPDVRRIAIFMTVYIGLVMFLKVSHKEVAKQLMTAVSIGCGSKLLEVMTKK